MLCFATNAKYFAQRWGIIIGVGAVIAMVGVGNGAKADVEASIATLGKNMILVTAGNYTSGGVRGGYGRGRER